MIGKKIVCMRNEKIEKKLSAPEVHLEKCLQRPPCMLCKIWGILKKLSAQPEWREKLASAQSMVEKTFLPPRNHDPPRENNGPSLTPDSLFIGF